MNSDEKWLPVAGFEGRYEVSNLGRVRSVDRVLVCSDGRKKACRGRVLRPGPRPSGHLTVALGGRRTRNVHTLVLEAFHGPRPNPEMQARHLDGNEKNNTANNLEWATRARNVNDRKYHKSAGHYILTPEAALQIKQELARADRRTQKEIALHFGVSKSTITAINLGKFHYDIVA